MSYQKHKQKEDTEDYDPWLGYNASLKKEPDFAQDTALRNPNKMDPEIKSAWVNALRSGSYKMTTGSFKEGNGENCSFCVLGVLTDLYDKVRKFDNCEASKWNGGAYKDGGGSSLPKDVMKWAGFGTNRPVLEDTPVGRTTIPSLNDSRKFNFDQIADMIEKNF